ncbi:MAG: hypothetical protein A2Y58_02140 [Chloroflexi bacterium RBG_13_51_52]|nr:MAG: hypothetical protein A2Y58_02140 [Chloroflexi bacterium RBG_13_51_52]
MVKTKFGHLIKEFSFKDYGPGLFRQGTEMNGKFLGYDVNIRYGAYWAAGKMGKAPYQADVHDFDQVLIFMGLDTYDMGYLGAEIELTMGEEKETHMITTATAVAIPKGTPHGPANILRMDDRFIYMTVSLAPELKGKPVKLSDKPGKRADFMRSKYRENVQHLAFTRNGPWHYGPLNQDTHEGAITDIHGKDFDFHMSYESMNKAPYRFGPVPDKPHVHPYTEFLLFMGADPDDSSVLGAEVEMYMGKEMEKHVITKPAVAIQPAGHSHCPLIVNNQDRPWIFAVVRPWGHTGKGPRGYVK